jgi:MinD superfamily P-loop ATPase
VFLQKVLAGAAVVAGGVGCSARSSVLAQSSAAAVTAPDEIAYLDLHEAARLVRQKKVSPVQLVQACLTRIDALNPVLNAFITVTAETALAQGAAS